MSELKNYRHIAIINVICELCMIIVQDRVNTLVEESGMLGDVYGGFRNGIRTEANLFIVERLIEMTRRRKVCCLLLLLIWRRRMIEWTEKKPSWCVESLWYTWDNGQLEREYTVVIWLSLSLEMW